MHASVINHIKCTPLRIVTTYIIYVHNILLYGVVYLQISLSGVRPEMPWDNLRDTSRMTSIDSGCGVSDEGTASTETDQLPAARLCTALPVATPSQPGSYVRHPTRRLGSYRVTASIEPTYRHVGDATRNYVARLDEQTPVVDVEHNAVYSHDEYQATELANRKQVTFIDGLSASALYQHHSREDETARQPHIRRQVTV